MNLKAMHELVSTGEYDLQVRPVNDMWVLQIQRKNSDRRFELENKRGERRYFKTIDAAVKVVMQLGAYSVEVWTDDSEIPF